MNTKIQLSIAILTWIILVTSSAFAQENFESPINVKKNNGLAIDPFEEAIWFNGTQFSWGFDGTWNQFRRPITIGTNLEPFSQHAIRITESGKQIYFDQNGELIFNGGVGGVYHSGHMYTTSNGLNIEAREDIIFESGDNSALSVEKMRLTSSGDLGIGTTNPVCKLDVRGDICLTGSINNPSDIRFKNNIQNIENAVMVISQLEPKTYTFDTEKFAAVAFPTELQYGLIAQEVEKVLPAIISSSQMMEGDDTQYLSVDYIKLIPLLVQAIQEQQMMINDLKTQNSQIMARLEPTSAEVRNTNDKYKIGISPFSF